LGYPEGATKRAILFVEVAQFLGTWAPSAVAIQLAMTLPDRLVGWSLGATHALDGIVYRTAEIVVSPSRHLPHLKRGSKFNVQTTPFEIKTKNSILNAEWVITRSRWSSGKRNNVVLFLHGGAFFTFKATAMYRAVTRRLAHLGFAVLAVDYRKAPRHPFPAALDDCVAAYSWLIQDVGTDPSDILVLGDSAGGHLGLALLRALEKGNCPLPRGICVLSPWVDLSTESYNSAKEDPFDFMGFLYNPRVLPAKLYAGNMEWESFLQHEFIHLVCGMVC
jgi:acetyl esterase/lipase